MFLILRLTLLFTVAAIGHVRAQQACLSDAECADSSLCNGIERCVSLLCTPGPPLACDDGDPCTTDVCDPAAGCGHQDVACQTTCGAGDDGERCSDGTACTTGDTCSGSACVGTPLDCDDGDPCTSDTCDIILGCVYAEVPNPPTCVTNCSFAADHTPCAGDGNPCTQDGCLEGACQIGLIQVVRQCADADFCNGDEFCSPIKGCEPGPPLVCDDGNACDGTESCNAASGCVAGTPPPDGTTCDDGQVCTSTDACSAGACTGTALTCDDADPATADVCTEATGCLHCTPLLAGKGKLVLRFPAAPNPGKITTKGQFLPPGAFDPTTAAGADLLVHDGSSVIQHSHVAGGAFVVSGNGKVQKFADRSGTVAMGLQKLRHKAGTNGKPDTFVSKGLPTGTFFGSDTSTSVTLIAGPACTTATLPCELKQGGKARRCKSLAP